MSSFLPSRSVQCSKKDDREVNDASESDSTLCTVRGGARFPGAATFKTVMTADRSTCVRLALRFCACSRHSKMHAQLACLCRNAARTQERVRAHGDILCSVRGLRYCVDAPKASTASEFPRRGVASTGQGSR